MSFTFDVSGLERGIQLLDNKVDIALRLYAETSALQVQNDAKSNAKWTDRTGEARRRLVCTSGKIAKGYRLTLAHGVDYGLWLELANEKRYAIIETTIRVTGTMEVLPGLEKLIEKLSMNGV